MGPEPGTDWHLGGVFTLCNAIFVWVFGFLSDKIGFRKRFWALLFSVSLSMPCILSMPDLATPQPLLWQSSLTLARSMPISGPMLLPLFGKNKSNVTISWSSMIASAGAMLARCGQVCGSYNNFFHYRRCDLRDRSGAYHHSYRPPACRRPGCRRKVWEAHGITEAEYFMLISATAPYGQLLKLE